MAQLSAKLTQANEVWHLKLKGIIDSNTATRMWHNEDSASLLKKLTQTQAKKLVLDLTNVDFIDSHGLRILLNAHTEFTQAKVALVLYNPNAHLKRLLRIMQFDRVLTIEFKD
jgi:anti-sigma B factor antagonist